MLPMPPLSDDCVLRYVWVAVLSSLPVDLLEQLSEALPVSLPESLL